MFGFERKYDSLWSFLNERNLRYHRDSDRFSNAKISRFFIICVGVVLNRCEHSIQELGDEVTGETEEGH